MTTQQQKTTGKRRTLLADLVAGATGAVAGAPQAMGFAIIAQIPPIYGLYTAIVATIVGSFTAGSTFMTIAPTNAVALVVGSTLTRYDEGLQIELLFLLTVIVGVFQLLFGVLRLGGLTRFFSNAVMTGFITGAGLLIILGQLRNLTGVRLETPSSIAIEGLGIELSGALPRFLEWVAKIPQSDWPTVVIGVLTLVIIYALRQTRFKNAAILTALVATALIANLLGWTSVADVSSISEIPSGLPSPVMPNWGFTGDLLFPGLALAILALVQSAALTQSIPEPDGSIPDVSRDFVGQGLANIVAGFFQGMPSGGSLSRTAVNVAAGAKTRLANVFSGLFIGGTVLLLGSLIERVALAALAGQLVIAAASLIRPQNILMVWRVNRSARLSMLVTFVATLLLPLEFSIYIGVGLSLMLYVYNSAEQIHVVRLVPEGDNLFREEPVPETLPSNEPIILSVSGNLYFAAVKRLEEMIPVPTDSECPIVILRLRDNFFLGSTGLRFLHRYCDLLEAQNGHLLLTGISKKIETELSRTGVLKTIGEDRVFFADDVVFSGTMDALRYAQEKLGCG